MTNPEIDRLIIQLADPHLSEQAVASLVQHGSDAVEPLCQALEDQHPNVRHKAAEALGRIRDARAVEPLCRKLKEDAVSDDELSARRSAVAALVKIGAAAVAPLYQELQYGSWDVRRLAAVTLGEIGPAAVEPLCEALGNKDRDVRRFAAEALGKIGDARAVEPLCKALEDKSAYVRQEAAAALEQMGDARAVEPLCQALQDKRWDVRWSAAAALEKIVDARAVEALCQALRDKVREVRQKAAVVLEQMGDEETLPRKVLAETRLTPPQRLSGLEALQRVRYRDRRRVLRYPLPDIRTYCQEMRQDEDKAVREGAQAVLAFLEGSTLLRPGRQEETSKPEELLRSATPSASEALPEEMLHASEEGSVPAVPPPKRRGLLDRWLARKG